MIIDITTPQAQTNIKFVKAYISREEDLQAFNEFLAQYTKIDFEDPTVGQAAKKSCGGGNCCIVPSGIEF